MFRNFMQNTGYKITFYFVLFLLLFKHFQTVYSSSGQSIEDYANYILHLKLIKQDLPQFLKNLFQNHSKSETCPIPDLLSANYDSPTMRKFQPILDINHNYENKSNCSYSFRNDAGAQKPTIYH